MVGWGGLLGSIGPGSAGDRRRTGGSLDFLFFYIHTYLHT